MDVKCIFCEVSVSEGDNSVVQNPTKAGLQSIFKAAEKRNDTCGKKILALKKEILDGRMKVKFHVACRKTYTSSPNIEWHLRSESGPSLSNQSLPVKTRSYDGSNFNIRQMCLFCGKTGQRKKEKLTCVQTGELVCIIDRNILNGTANSTKLKIQYIIRTYPYKYRCEVGSQNSAAKARTRPIDQWGCQNINNYRNR